MELSLLMGKQDQVKPIQCQEEITGMSVVSFLEFLKLYLKKSNEEEDR